MPEVAVAVPSSPPRGLLRVAAADAWIVGAALSLGAGLAAVAALVPATVPGLVATGAAVALATWWGSNTVSHIHLHSPVFRDRRWNRLFALYLTAALGVPQSLWRARHLWHHAGERAADKPGLPRGAMLEIALVLALWAGLGALRPIVLFCAWIPGWLVAMALCRAQGRYEHEGAGPVGISVYGRHYNLFWFNDGHHVEHHRQPQAHWTTLPSLRGDGGPESALPPVLRPLPLWAAALRRAANRAQARLLLVPLERLALAWPRLQRFMVESHERAFLRLLPAVDGLRSAAAPRVCVVGGGLFPRTALVLARVLPSARVTLLDRDPDHLARAAALLAERGLPPVEAEAGELREDGLARFDLVVVPLAYVGDREALYRRATRCGCPAIVLHDWLWRRRGRAGTRISLLVLKRLNLA